MHRRDTLTIALLENDLNQAEASELTAECRRDPRLARILGELQGVDALLRANFAREAQAVATRDAVMASLRRDRDSSTSSRRLASAVLARITPSPRRRPHLLRAALATAAVLVCAIAGVTLIGERGADAPVVTTAVGAVLEADPLPVGAALPVDAMWTVNTGGHLVLVWPDGTMVRLAGPASGRTMTDGMQLDRGRLRATVQPRKAQPAFTVVTPHCRVAVVGTRFSVVTTTATTDVTVDSGAVSVQADADGKPILLSAGERMSQTAPPSSAPLATGVDLAPPWRSEAPAFASDDTELTVAPSYRHRYGGAPLVRTARWRPPAAAHPLRWADRARPDAVWTAATGAALEADLALVTALSSDLWLVVPVHADHSWIDNAARLVTAHLPANRRLYLQYGDHLADPGSPAGTWIRNRVDGNQVAARLYAARRIQAMHATFTAAMADPTRLRVVVPTWGDADRTATLLRHGVPPDSCLAIDLSDDSPTTLAAWFDLARQWGLQPIGYGLGTNSPDTAKLESSLSRWQSKGGGPVVTRLQADAAAAPLLRILRRRTPSLGHGPTP